MKSPDFFNAKQFPFIELKSKSVKKAGNDLQVTADLTMHGVTKVITLPVNYAGEVKDPRGALRAG